MSKGSGVVKEGCIVSNKITIHKCQKVDILGAFFYHKKMVVNDSKEDIVIFWIKKVLRKLLLIIIILLISIGGIP